MNESDYGYRLISQAIIRQAATDFETASRFLSQSTTEEQLKRVEINVSKNVPSSKQKLYYEEAHMRSVIKEVSKFFESEWCMALAGDSYSLTMFLETLKYRDWRRQCARDGFIIPRGNEYISPKDFTEEEQKWYVRVYESHRDTAEISRWYKSLSPQQMHQMKKVRSFDNDAIYRVLGVRFE